MRKFEAKWHSGPPPFPGWWSASYGRDPRIWRWWNGAVWSLAVSYCRDADHAGRVAKQAAHTSIALIEWCHYYPANARVPRINPNIKGDKS